MSELTQQDYDNLGIDPLAYEKKLEARIAELEGAMHAVFGVVAAYGTTAEYNDFKEVLDATMKEPK